MTFNLNDPTARAKYAERYEIFKARAINALNDEACIDPDGSLGAKLASIGAKADSGAGALRDPVDALKGVFTKALNGIHDDAGGIYRALRLLNAAFNASSEETKIEIIEGLTAAGVDADVLTAGLDALSLVVTPLAKAPTIKGRTGVVLTVRNAAIREAWLLVEKAGLNPYAGSRVIAQLLDGNTALSGNIRSQIVEMKNKRSRH